MTDQPRALVSGSGEFLLYQTEDGRARAEAATCRPFLQVRQEGSRRVEREGKRPRQQKGGKKR